jgi:SsrA-binding protein
MPGAPSKPPPPDVTLATNRRARHDYEIIDSLEAGLSLTGAEVKSCRAGHASLQQAYAAFQGPELFVLSMHILPYAAAGAGFAPVDPDRPKKLLLHRRELTRLLSLIQLKGLTLVPLKLYATRGRIKLQIGIAKGRHLVDKREDLRRRQDAREARDSRR